MNVETLQKQTKQQLRGHSFTLLKPEHSQSL